MENKKKLVYENLKYNLLNLKFVKHLIFFLTYNQRTSFATLIAMKYVNGFTIQARSRGGAGGTVKYSQWKSKY